MTFTCRKCGRADVVLSAELEISRSQIEKFIKTVGIEINGKKINKSGFKLEIGDEISYEFENMVKQKSEYEVDFDVDILYEDDDLLVVNKPPFLTVHGAPSVKEATLVDWLKKKGISLSTISGEERHGIVHRIDKETSGALVVAKNNESHAKLSKQLENKSMGRYYLALIDLPLKDNIVVEKPIARNPKNRLKMAVVEDGKHAKSAFLKLLSLDSKKCELIAAKLYTGRTHQIRVHLNSLSRHILGDSLYGFKSQKGKIKRVMLHAYILYFIHPKSGKLMQIKAPFFEDFENVMYRFFNKEKIHENIKTDTIINSFNTIF
ncbi:MAG: RluA family pseudouridine synthase [Sulfurospirillum sp.]